MNYPEPQSYLNDEEKIIYHEICKHLSDVDALEAVDSYGLSMTASWLWLYHENHDRVRENIGVQVYKTGAEGVSAHFTVMTKAAAIFEKMSAKYGLSNKDRELMMKFKGHKQVEDALDEI